MILLDTTILVYAVGEPHPLREPCRRLLSAHGQGRVDATTTVEVIQEFAHVRARRRPRADAAALARSFAAAFPLLSTIGDDLQVGLSLFEQFQELGAFDAVLVAVALNRRAEALVSADQAFRTTEHLLRWVDPATPAIERLLAP